MNGFTVTDLEQKKFNDWLFEHDKTCPYTNRQGSIGGRLTYCFSPTSLGVVVQLKCACGKECDATEYENW